jgi:hypothetical protein
MSRYLRIFNDFYNKYIGDGTGVAWDVFWDYQHYNPRMRLDKKAQLLLMYLNTFGMNRGGALNRFTSTVLSDFLRKSTSSISFLGEWAKLDSGFFFDEKNKSDFERHVGNIRSGLGDDSTDVFVTKVLLALTGEIPAFDQKFCLGFWGTETPRKMNFKNMNDVAARLSKLKITRRSVGRRGTRLGYGVHIPFGRIVDCVFWQLGQDRKGSQLAPAS